MWCLRWPSESVKSAKEVLIRIPRYEECAREIEFRSFLKYDDLWGCMWQYCLTRKGFAEPGKTLIDGVVFNPLAFAPDRIARENNV